MAESSFEELLAKVNGGVTYHDGWTFAAIDWSGRQAGAMLVRVGFQVDDYAEFNAPDYAFDETGERKPKFGNRTHFAITPAMFKTDLEFWREFFANLERIESHESREAFRVFDGERWVGPLNPHNPDGQMAWANGDMRSVREDLSFGDINLDTEVLDYEFEEAGV